MSLPEKKESPSSSLSQKGVDLAVVNMILGITLCAAMLIIWSSITNSGGKIFSSDDFFSLAAIFFRAFEVFIFLTPIGIIVSIVPTLIGAKVLSIWLQRNNVTRKSALIAGAVIGAITISLLLISVSAFLLISRSIGSFESMVSVLLRVFPSVTICAALAGGMTGFQLAKFIETQNTPSPAQIPS